MRLLATYCPDCRLYLGMQDGDGEVPATFRMPHLPGCHIGDAEREQMAAPSTDDSRAEIARLRRQVRGLQEQLST